MQVSGAIIGEVGRMAIAIGLTGHAVLDQPLPQAVIGVGGCKAVDALAEHVAVAVVGIVGLHAARVDPLLGPPVFEVPNRADSASGIVDLNHSASGVHGIGGVGAAAVGDCGGTGEGVVGELGKAHAGGVDLRHMGIGIGHRKGCFELVNLAVLIR